MRSLHLTFALVLALCAPWAASAEDLVQAIRDGEALYTLSVAGNVIRQVGSGVPEVLMQDPASLMLAVGGGKLYCLDSSGRVSWWRGGRSWIRIFEDTNAAASQIFVRDGRPHCQVSSGLILVCTDPFKKVWVPANFTLAERQKIFNKLHRRN